MYKTSQLPLKHFITESFLQLDSSLKLSEAANIMRQFGFRQTVVKKNNSFIGILDLTDLETAIQLGLENWTISNIHLSNNLKLSYKATIKELEQVFLSTNSDILPVVKNNLLIGIINVRDFFRLDSELLPQKKTTRYSANFFKNRIKKLQSVSIYELILQIAELADAKNYKVYLVGGFVRDLLLNRPNFDIDIAVEGNAVDFVNILSEAFKCEFSAHADFYTASIVYNGCALDFNSTRTEYYAHIGALPQIKFSSLADDLKRRDFALNAIALSLNKSHFLDMIDLYNGTKDISLKTLRFIKPLCFFEDPTRIFRALRFAVRYNFKLDLTTHNALKQAIKAGVVKHLSLKRIATEISLLFKEVKPEKQIQTIIDYGLLKYIHSHLRYKKNLPQNLRRIRTLINSNIFFSEIDITSVYWVALLSKLPPKSSIDLVNNFSLPHSTNKLTTSSLKLIPLLAKALDKIKTNDAMQIFKLLNSHPPERILLLLHFFGKRNSSKKILLFINKLRFVSPSISGSDILSLGISPGPHLGAILDKICELKIAGQNLTRKDELKIALQTHNDSKN